MPAVAKALGISRSTVKRYAAAARLRACDQAEDVGPPGPARARRLIAAEKRRALDYYRAGDIDLAARILRDAERRDSLRSKFEKLTENFRPSWRQSLAIVDRFVLRLHGITPTPEQIAAGCTPEQRWAVWQVIPPYYQKLRALGAIMLPFGRAEWPDRNVPPPDLLPPTPPWLPCDPWDETISLEDWMSACGAAIQALSGKSPRH